MFTSGTSLKNVDKKSASWLILVFLFMKLPYCCKASPHRLPDNVTEIAVKAALFPDVTLLMQICAKRKAGGIKQARRFSSFLSPSRGPLHFVTRHSRFALAFVVDQRAKNEESEEKAGCKGLFASSVGHIWYAGIDTEHATFYCFAVVLFTWRRYRAILTKTYPLYLLLNCR